MTAPFMRPAGGAKVAGGGPPCPEWHLLDQHTPAGMRSCQACCIRCGRVTARRDADGYPSCVGELPTPPPVQIGASA